MTMSRSNPAQYRPHLRLERASWLLRCTGLKVTEIGQECGFSNAAQFARMVRQHYHVSPANLRRRGRNL